MVRHSTWILIFSLLLTGPALAAQSEVDPDALRQAIESRDAEQRARDKARHPARTLAFFKVAPGMTVAEGLPGGGWYTTILANYLGSEGTLYGVNYSDSMWPLFPRATDEWIAKRMAVTAKFPSMVEGFTDNGIKIGSFTFDTVPQDTDGTVDRVLMIRAMHNLNRFESEAGTRTKALAAIHKMLKDDGMVGVVQHRSPAANAGKGADGSGGYLAESELIQAFEKAGFELVASSEINANPLDKPSPEDIVWRLPPSLATSKDDPELRAKMEAIGESDRMTLLFRKAK